MFMLLLLKKSIFPSIFNKVVVVEFVYTVSRIPTTKLLCTLMASFDICLLTQGHEIIYSNLITVTSTFPAFEDFHITLIWVWYETYHDMAYIIVAWTNHIAYITRSYDTGMYCATWKIGSCYRVISSAIKFLFLKLISYWASGTVVGFNKWKQENEYCIIREALW